MRAKDKCPSCFQPIAETDFLCPNCELILDPSQMPEKPVTDVSVVRRLLEIPQRGVPAEKPGLKLKTEGLEGPTRKLDLGPELAGVPVVVATLSKKMGNLSELEAWVVSLIDGLHDSKALAQKTGVRDFELRIVLRTLQDKRIIDFADEPLSDADLDLPEVLGELAAEEPASARPEGANVDRRDARFMAPASSAPPLTTAEILASEASFVPPMGFKAPRPSAPRASAPVAPPGAGRAAVEPSPDDAKPLMTPMAGRPAVESSSARGRPLVTPGAGRAAVEPARGGIPPLPEGILPPPAEPAAESRPQSQPARAAVEPAAEPRPQSQPARAAVTTPPGAHRAAAPEFTPAGGRPAVPARAPSLAAVPYPGGIVEEKMNLPPSRAVGSSPTVKSPSRPPQQAAPPPPPSPPPAPVERTDPRIAYVGPANRKVLDALKKVKRRDEPSEPAAPASRNQGVEHNVDDVLARDTLQVALRMEQGGRFDEAIRFLEKSIGQSPEAPSLYNRLGIILMRERADYRRAEEMIRKAVDLAPENSVYAENLKQVISKQAMRRSR